MDDMEKKLSLFKEAVEKEAIEQKNKIELETMEEKQSRIKEAKQRLEEESKRRLEEQKAKIERQYKQITAKEIYLYRKDLLLKRDEVITNIFNGVAERIKKFMDTEEYYEYLKNCIQSAADHFNCTEMTVFLRNEDMEKGESIVKSLSNLKIELKENANIVLGGAIIKKSGTNLITDETFDHKLTEAEANFVSESGLALEDI